DRCPTDPQETTTVLTFVSMFLSTFLATGPRSRSCGLSAREEPMGHNFDRTVARSPRQDDHSSRSSTHHVGYRREVHDHDCASDRSRLPASASVTRRPDWSQSIT